MKKELYLLSKELIVYKDVTFNDAVNILSKSGFFDYTDRIYCHRFFAQRALLVQAPTNNKNIRIATSVINIVSILSV